MVFNRFRWFQLFFQIYYLDFYLQAFFILHIMIDNNDFYLVPVVSVVKFFLGLASSPYETSTVSLSVRLSVTKVLIFPTIRFL